MRPVSDAFNDAIRTSHKRVVRVFLLNSALEAVDELTGAAGIAVDGSISVDADRRRSCSLTLVNDDATWSPIKPDDPLFPNRLLRIERGVEVDGAEELVSLGVFVIDRPVTNVVTAGSTISITAQDRVKFALKSRFTVPTTFAAGESIGSVVQQVAQAAGMGTTFYRLADGGKVLAADRTFETNVDRWPALVDLARDYALRLYVDADGYLVLEPAPTTATLPDPVWTFARGADAVMLGVTKGLNDDRLYNHVLVSGESASQAPLAAEARDLNPDSPAYNPPDGSGPIGDRLFTYTSAMIRSIEQAAEVASALLLDVALIEEDVSIPAVVHPALESGDAIRIVESESRTDDTYLLETLSIPLGSGAMTVGVKKLRNLAAA